MKIHCITPSCYLVHDGKEGILIGCVSEVLKFLAEQQLSQVLLRAIVLSDTRHVQGISNWAIEFPNYKALLGVLRNCCRRQKFRGGPSSRSEPKIAAAVRFC